MASVTNRKCWLPAVVVLMTASGARTEEPVDDPTGRFQFSFRIGGTAGNRHGLRDAAAAQGAAHEAAFGAYMTGLGGTAITKSDTKEPWRGSLAYELETGRWLGRVFGGSLRFGQYASERMTVSYEGTGSGGQSMKGSVDYSTSAWWLTAGVMTMLGPADGWHARIAVLGGPAFSRTKMSGRTTYTTATGEVTTHFGDGIDAGGWVGDVACEAGWNVAVFELGYRIAGNWKMNYGTQADLDGDGDDDDTVGVTDGAGKAVRISFAGLRVLLGIAGRF